MPFVPRIVKLAERSAQGEVAGDNAWCRVLGIAVPDLAVVASHREANTYALLVVALLERGAPMTLEEVARRIAEAGIVEAGRALAALKRCRPARPPVYRDGDAYHLDPHDDELDLWGFRLGLRPARVQVASRAVEAAPLPDPSVCLTEAELDEGWKGVGLVSWSAQRLVLAVLDARGGGALAPEEVVAEVAARTKWHALGVDSAKFRRRGSAVAVMPDGRWAIARDAAAGEALRAARVAVRDRVALARKYAAMRPDPAASAARREEFERERAEHGAALARMSRVLLVAFPKKAPRVVSLLDVGGRTLTTFVDEELAEARRRLADYDMWCGVDVRAMVRELGVDDGDRRLGELGPPQKTRALNQRGRTLKITTALLIQGSCGISRPLGDPGKLAGYLRRGELTKLRRRLEADAKALFALHEYGRLHGGVRLRWGFLDEMLPAPWVHPDEAKLRDLEETALAMDAPLEVVVGTAPGWEAPWARARLVRVEPDPRMSWRRWLVGEDGAVIGQEDVQRARLAVALH